MRDKDIRDLWLAVITQAFFDVKTENKKKDLIKYKLRANNWVQPNNSDFISVCKLAGCYPNFVYENFRKLKR